MSVWQKYVPQAAPLALTFAQILGPQRLPSWTLQQILWMVMLIVRTMKMKTTARGETGVLRIKHCASRADGFVSVTVEQTPNNHRQTQTRSMDHHNLPTHPSNLIPTKRILWIHSLYGQNWLQR